MFILFKKLNGKVKNPLKTFILIYAFLNNKFAMNIRPGNNIAKKNYNILFNFTTYALNFRLLKCSINITIFKPTKIMRLYWNLKKN